VSEPAPRKRKAKKVAGEVVGVATASALSSHVWQDLHLVLSGSGQPVANMDNVARVIDGYRSLRGTIYFDEFSGRVVTTQDAGTREWSDADTLRLTLFLQRSIGMGNVTSATVDAAVAVVAYANRRNSAQESLRALRWDGIERLPLLMSAGFGAASTDYTSAVGRCFMVGMVARILRPGCKADAMPVLEGPQGIKKSTGLRALAGDDLFAEAAESVTSKDFPVGLQGKALIEIAEMDAFGRSEVTAVKRVLTCQSDRYRAPYGRRAEDHPRTCVFAGTTNRSDWNRDETGARRFWPIACTAVDLDWIRCNREQLLAEAVARFDRGESWWDVPADDAKREQDARRTHDEWEVPIRRYLEGIRETQVAAVLEHGLGMPPERWGKSEQMRVATVLRDLGFTKSDTWRDGGKAKVWIRDESEGGDGGKT